MYHNSPAEFWIFDGSGVAVIGATAVGAIFPATAPLTGSDAETIVWNAISEKDGWSVVPGRGTTKNANGDIQVYDGYAISPTGYNIGLEVKGGDTQKILLHETSSPVSSDRSVIALVLLEYVVTYSDVNKISDSNVWKRQGICFHCGEPSV